jgi:conjugative relaxase-like TrwC/TraI family protein
MAIMGAESVAYHEANVVDRDDDHAGAALAYYGSRGETPLVWGGSGAERLGLAGQASPESYRAVFGPGGARMPWSGAKLVTTRRPGIELVVSPHKSVAELGVLGRADDMHAIVDAERDATLAYLDAVVRKLGGRRGDPVRFTPTGGLTWATSRHATTRAGDPQVHDHVLVANVVWMGDERGGWKGLDTAFVRDQLHAATAVGRTASARVAVELGYGIEPDAGRSGRLGGWRIAGLPDAALAVHSKRAAEIEAHAGEGASYRVRNLTARQFRDRKRHEPVPDLLRRWRVELTEAGFPPEELWGQLVAAARRRPQVAERLDPETLAVLIRDVLDLDSRLSRLKVFDRADVIVAVAPQLHGLPVSELDRVVDAVIADAGCVPLIGVAGARTQPYATAAVLAAEERVAELAETLVAQPAPRIPAEAAQEAVAAVEARVGAPLSPGQRRTARGLLTSGSGLELVVGVAGSGKTSLLGAVADGFTRAGYTVLGTATSGLAARGLGEEAGLDESRTIASLVWRLEHDRIRLNPGHVLILDEAGMTDDPDLGRLLAAVARAGAKAIVVGDDRQLGAVGPGGGLGALLGRHPQRVHRLTVNVRQRDPGEQRALAELRAGRVERAVAFYERAGRIVAAPTRDETIAAMVEAWAADVTAWQEPLLLAWRRADVDELNAAARAAWDRLGRLYGPELEAPGGRRYRFGDRVLMLTPGPAGAWVTSEQATVVEVNLTARSLKTLTPDGRVLELDRDATGAERLTHAYALTVHRAQGATSDTAHVLDSGGGRELAYVAMSRARGPTHVYVPASGSEDAAEHLRWAWTDERRPRWARDQGRPPPTPRELIREFGRLSAFVDRQVFAANAGEGLRRGLRRRAIEAEIAELQTGTGRHAATPAGEAARDLAAADTAVWRAQREAANATGPLARRRARRAVDAAVAELGKAQADWGLLGAPELARLRNELAQTYAGARTRFEERDAWLTEHSSIAERLRQLSQRISDTSGQAIQRGPDTQMTPSTELDLGL